MKLVSFRTLRSICLDFIILLVPLSLIIISIPFVFRITAPFLAGIFLYFTAKPLNRILRQRSFPASLSAFLALFIISAIVFTALRFLGEKIISELYSFTRNPPEIYFEAIDSAEKGISFLSGKLPVSSFLKKFPGISSAIQEQIAAIVTGVSRFLINFAKGIPGIFIGAFAAIFTAFFLLKDDDKILCFLNNFFGEKFCNGCRTFKTAIFSVAASYLKAQLIIEGIVFLVLLTGFLILKVKYAFILSFLTAIVDAVPVFGTGTVLLPMALINFITGNNPSGWGLLILYGITLLTRQLCEPKIVGKTFGIHPLLALFSLYAGMKLFGIFGLIFGPFFAILLKILLFSR